MIYDQEGNEVNPNDILEGIVVEWEGKVPEFEKKLQERCKEEGLAYAYVGRDMRGHLFVIGNEVYALHIDPYKVSYQFVGHAQQR